jgi:hypothetical protein
MGVNRQDTDDAKYFTLGLGVGVFVGTVSTFIGNILTHRYLNKDTKKII